MLPILQTWMRLIILSYIHCDKSHGMHSQTLCIKWEKKIDQIAFDFVHFCCFSKLDDEIVSLVDFTPELLVHCVSKCIRLIQPDLDVPESLPPGKLVVCTKAMPFASISINILSIWRYCTTLQCDHNIGRSMCGKCMPLYYTITTFPCLKNLKRCEFISSRLDSAVTSVINRSCTPMSRRFDVCLCFWLNVYPRRPTKTIWMKCIPIGNPCCSTTFNRISKSN